MPRYAAKVDANHLEIVEALRDAGGDRISVVSSARMGDGFPDLVIGLDGDTYLAEVKDGDKPPSRRALTPDQVAFVNNWRGRNILLFYSPEAARAWVEHRLDTPAIH